MRVALMTLVLTTSTILASAQEESRGRPPPTNRQEIRQQLRREKGEALELPMKPREQRQSRGEFLRAEIETLNDERPHLSRTVPVYLRMGGSRYPIAGIERENPESSMFRRIERESAGSR